ncbi:hypothetical protein NX059_007943 [Plenodomus lindquistii]|nr:hypothetical protein NX059_007943 [Plenodomus lindquistii]
MSTASNQEGFTLFVECTINNDKMEEFLGHYSTMLRQITLEKEFLSIEVFRDDDNPNKLCWVENWNGTTAWFYENILTKPYVKEYLEKTMALSSDRTVKTWHRLGGNFAIANAGVFQSPQRG